MNYFDNISVKSGSLTVLGVTADSRFVTALKKELEKRKEPIDLIVPDMHFTVHSESEIEQFASHGQIIGVVGVEILEKKICDVVENSAEFCKITDLCESKLMFTEALGKVVEEHEKYDIMYIDNVDTPQKRFLARELAKTIRGDMDIYMVDTDTDFVETLIKKYQVF